MCLIKNKYSELINILKNSSKILYSKLLTSFFINYVKDYKNKNYKIITNEELLTSQCDILIPAALENQITEENANEINCKVILEGANGPTNTVADKILFDKGIHIIPDTITNIYNIIWRPKFIKGILKSIFRKYSFT